MLKLKGLLFVLLIAEYRVPIPIHVAQSLPELVEWALLPRDWLSSCGTAALGCGLSFLGNYFEVG
jgi:hypothetical protein